MNTFENMLPSSRFLSFISEHRLLEPDKKVLLAVSGGRDSVLMVHLFNAAGLNFSIAHCNFGLRGEESEGDEAFVRQLASDMEVPFHIKRFDTAQFAAENNLSIQMAARELRYNWFEEVRRQNKYDCIALAHHASDVTETMLLNLVRGTGIAGLHGILPKRGRLIRPMLFLDREEVSTIVEALGISFREDSSNLSSKYARNKIRLEVVPKLKELNQGLDLTFGKNSRRFAQVEDFLNKEVQQLRKKIFKQFPSSFIEIRLSDLKELNPRELLLFELFRPFGFSEAVLDDLVSCWDGEAGKMFTSPGYLLLLDRDKLILEPREVLPQSEMLWPAGTSSLSYQKLKLSSTVSLSGITLKANPDKAFFDEGLLQYPLKLRQWEEGDYFFPFGMSGRKKLSDFFRELKIPVTQKSKVPLLVNGNGDILWVIGFRSDNRYKVSSETKKVITFERSSYYGH